MYNEAAEARSIAWHTVSLTCQIVDATTTLPRLVHSITRCVGDVHPVIPEGGGGGGDFAADIEHVKGKLPDPASECQTRTCSQLMRSGFQSM